MKRAFGKIYENSLLFCAVISFFLTLIIECLSRHSVIKAFVMLFFSPHIFLFNTAVIMLTMIWGLFIKKRDFAFFSVSIVWLGLGISNFILQFFRVTPLCGGDFLILKAALGIIDLYMTIPQMIMTLAAILGAFAGIGFLFVKGRKKAPNIKKGAFSAVILAVAVFSVSLSGVLNEDFSNLITAYKSYGFAYSFLNTVFDRGIDRPKEYSEKQFKDALRKIKSVPDEEVKEKPNIVFVQLESFFNVNRLKNVRFSENPIPNFTALEKEYSGGLLEVPSFGGNTANTEFEVLTGIDISFFGAGECLFETELNKKTSESTAFNLKEYGYKAHAIHNHTATFYDRNKVYANLGFDTFTSSEYMNITERNAMTWAKDSVLIRYINEALDSTENADFVYAVTVQAHGNYPKIPVESDKNIEVSGDMNEEEKNKLTYYVNQLYETDEFIGELINELEKRNEPTVAVFYGDHLPAFKISDDDLSEGDIYKTDYVIWDNIGLERKNESLSANMLSSSVLSNLGFNSGLVNKLNIYYKDNPEYMNFSKIIACDIFKSEKREYSEHYSPSDLQMGVNPPALKEVTLSENTLKIKGTGFTQASVIMINNSKKETVFVNENTLLAHNIYMQKNNIDIIKVCQETQTGEILSQTKPTFNIHPN